MMEPYPIINGDVPAMYTVLALHPIPDAGTWVSYEGSDRGRVECWFPAWARSTPRVGDTLALFGLEESRPLWGQIVRGAALNSVVQWYYPSREALWHAVQGPPWQDALLGQVG